MTADRYFFCHIQKTGGVALLRRLRNHFPEEAIYPAPSDGRPPDTTVSVAHLLERWRRREREISVVCGHFPLCTTELLGGGFRTFTVLRDPVERILSSLRHHRRAHPEEGDRPLEQVYDDSLRTALLYDNHMVRMLSLTTEEMSDGMYTTVEHDGRRLDRAIAALERIDVVGLQSEHEEFCLELERTFGWDLGAPVRSNVTDPESSSTELRLRIAADNPFDLALYDHARDLVARRSARTGHDSEDSDVPH